MAKKKKKKKKRPLIKMDFGGSVPDKERAKKNTHRLSPKFSGFCVAYAFLKHGLIYC
jgi:hypothetical protein